jgi:hypothetical protein
MSRCAGFQRRKKEVAQAVSEAEEQLRRIEEQGFSNTSPVLALTTAQLAYSSCVYLSAILFQIESGVGSRGSAAVFDEKGEKVPEDEKFRRFVLTSCREGNTTTHAFEPCREIPRNDGWFETVWADFREGRIFTEK